MNQSNFDKVNFDGFVAQFMGRNADSFAYTQRPIQVYPLSIASTLIPTPTPLFRAAYNFLLLFATGGGQQQVDNEIIELQANDVLFIREGHLNAIQSIRPDTTGHFIYVDSALLPQVFADGTWINRFTFEPHQAIAPQDMAWLCQCCALLAEPAQGKAPALEIQASLLRAIVLKLAEAWPSPSVKAERPAEISLAFQALLYEHFVARREVKFYAESLAVSENYLTRCVKQVTHKSPKQHINEVVIFHSMVLLQDLSKDISEVAYALNFSDPAYFGRLFKRVSQQTPTQYRAAFMQGLSG